MRPSLTALLLIVCSPLVAADRSAAITNSNQAGPDFRFVGEYVGSVAAYQDGVWRTIPLGLQVVALGDGTFEAVEYLGGLPGAGWNKEDRAVLPGRRTGSIVEIDARPVGVTVDGYTARVGRYGVSSVYGVLRRINRASPTLGRRPPREATVLFGPGGAPGFANATITEEGLLAEGAETREAYSDFTLHVEFRLPFTPLAEGQGRANSGVYLQRRYEVQILDSFGQEPVFNGAGAVYRTKPADLNMALPPLTWQTYDIHFRAARFDDGKKVEPARLTVWHNGVKIHDNFAVPNKTGAGKPEGPEPLPILLQDHRNPVRFRNVWIVDHTQYPDVDATPKIDPRTPHRPSPIIGPSHGMSTASRSQPSTFAVSD